MAKKRALPTFRWPCKIFLGSLDAGTPQKSEGRHDLTVGSLPTAKKSKFLILTSWLDCARMSWWKDLRVPYDPLANSSAGYAPRANLVIVSMLCF